MGLFRCWGAIHFSALAAAIGLGCLVSAAASADSSQFQQSKCWFEVPHDRQMTCGNLLVPESRVEPGTSRIKLAIAIFEPERERREPVVFLTGGPGQTAGIGSSEEVADWWYFLDTQAWTRGRRFIVLDQRGIGRSTPALDCSQFFDDDNWNHTTSRIDAHVSFDKLQAEEVKACHLALMRKGINLDAYNTLENAADVDNLRQALGIKRWVLYGVSYGTKLALTLMERYPSGISASILDSVLPLDVDYAGLDGRNLQRVLALMERDCARARHCFPEKQRLTSTVETIVRQLNHTPLTLRSDPGESGAERFKSISGDDFLEVLFGAFYDRDSIELLPLLIHNTYEQDYRLLARMIFSSGDDQGPTFFDGMDFSVTCAETGGTRLAAGTPRYLVKWASSAIYSWVCPLWLPKKAAMHRVRPIRSGIPSLLLAGEYDPVTPPEWAIHTAAGLKLGQVVMFPGIGHDVIDSGDCGAQVVSDFLENPRKKVKTACVKELYAPEFEELPNEDWD